MRRRAHSGFSLIEIMIVIAIVGLVSSTTVYGFRAIAKSELRGSATKLAGAVRYCFDRSITTGSYFRLVLDLDKNTYWAERSDERAYLTSGKESSPGGGKGLDVEAMEKKQLEADEKARQEFLSRGSAAQVLEPPPAPKRAKFQTFKDASLPQVKLKRVKLFDLYTPRQREAYTQGKAYLYFFPDGHTERALVRLNDGDEFYSLVIHPLTGRVEVKQGKVEKSQEFDTTDEEGNTQVGR